MEQRRAEDALHESEARYRGIVESTQAVFTRTDLEGRLLYANDAICRLIGMPLDAILGQSFFQWVHPDDQAATVASMEAVHARALPRPGREPRADAAGLALVRVGRRA